MYINLVYFATPAMQFVRCVILERPKGQYIDMMNSLKDSPLYVSTIVSLHGT